MVSPPHPPPPAHIGAGPPVPAAAHSKRHAVSSSGIATRAGGGAAGLPRFARSRDIWRSCDPAKKIALTQLTICIAPPLIHTRTNKSATRPAIPGSVTQRSTPPRLAGALQQTANGQCSVRGERWASPSDDCVLVRPVEPSQAPLAALPCATDSVIAPHARPMGWPVARPRFSGERMPICSSPCPPRSPGSPP